MTSYKNHILFFFQIFEQKVFESHHSATEETIFKAARSAASWVREENFILVYGAVRWAVKCRSTGRFLLVKSGILSWTKNSAVLKKNESTPFWLGLTIFCLHFHFSLIYLICLLFRQWFGFWFSFWYKKVRPFKFLQLFSMNQCDAYLCT